MSVKYEDLPSSLKKEFKTASAWDAVGDEAKKSIIKAFTNVYSSANKRREEIKNLDSGDFEAGDLGTVSDIASSRIREAELLTKTMRQLISEEGAFFAVNGPFQKGMEQAIKLQNSYFGSAQAGAKSYKELSKGITQFTKLNTEAFGGIGKFTGKLADQAATLSRLGLNLNEFRENLDVAIYDLGMGVEGVEGFNMSIKSLADDLDMLPGKVSRNFREIAKNLMYESSMIKSEYAKLEMLAQKTGLSATQIASQFGGSMDTIGGASSAAANLNAMLGRNAFSATQLLGMTESERAEAVREAIQSDSNIMADIQAGGVQGKFALKSVAEAMGMSGADARRFIQTGDADSVRGKLEKAIDEDPRVGMDSKVLQENFKNPAKSLGEQLDNLREQVRLTMTQEQNFFLQNRQAQLAAAERGAFPRLEKGARLSTMGMLTGKVTQEQYSEISKDREALAVFNQITKQAQLDSTRVGAVDRIAQLLSGDEADKAKGLRMARTMQRTPIQVKEQLEDLKSAGIAPEAMSIIARLSGKTGSFGGRIMYRFMMDRIKKGEEVDATLAGKAEKKAEEINSILGNINQGGKIDEDAANSALSDISQKLGDEEFSSVKATVSRRMKMLNATEDERRKAEIERVQTTTGASSPAGSGAISRSNSRDVNITILNNDNELKLKFTKVEGDITQTKRTIKTIVDSMPKK